MCWLDKVFEKRRFCFQNSSCDVSFLKLKFDFDVDFLVHVQST